jgi:3D-(3,5/4)-trihydroxycyclohexane-1,2-dione acylhydrolase (decyclizing)
VQLNAAGFDAVKAEGLPLVADAARGLTALSRALAGWQAPEAWARRAQKEIAAWRIEAERWTGPSNQPRPSDAQVLGAVNRRAGPGSTLVAAAGGLPGELHKLWRAAGPGSYHLEYGYSCMGYEIPGGIGVKLAHPEREVFVLVGDGSYLMMNSEIATSVALGLKLTIVLLDNRGFGCINRLQNAVGSASFNNLLSEMGAPPVDFRAHAESLGAIAVKVEGIAGLEAALDRARGNDRTTVIVLDTDPVTSTTAGGAWWDVAVPEVSDRAEIRAARSRYEKELAGAPASASSKPASRKEK